MIDKEHIEAAAKMLWDRRHAAIQRVPDAWEDADGEVRDFYREDAEAMLSQHLDSQATSDDGLEIYRWEYMHDPKFHAFVTIIVEEKCREVIDQRDQLMRDWPEQNKVQGLGRAIDLLHQLRDVLGLTSTGRHLAYRPGTEPNYLQLLHHHLKVIETFIGPDYEHARQRLADQDHR